MRVLATGGAGFIGSHLVDRLLAEGHDVYVVDNLERGRAINLRHCIDRIHFYTSDLRIQHTAFGEIDMVFDLAAKVFGVKDLYREPADLFSSNVKTTLNILEMCSRIGMQKYVYASSSCVYDFEGCPLPHVEDVVDLPNTAYGLSKLFGEQAVQVYSEQYGFKYGIARIFNVYGPRESSISPHVIPDFMEKAWLCSKGKKTFEILGDGKQTRAFVYVTDTVDGLVKVAERLNNDVVNLGSEDEISMNDLAWKVLDLFGVHDVEVVHLPVHPKDIRRRSGSTEKALDLIGWKPTTDLDRGLRRFQEWIVPQLESGAW